MKRKSIRIKKKVVPLSDLYAAAYENDMTVREFVVYLVKINSGKTHKRTGNKQT